MRYEMRVIIATIEQFETIKKIVRDTITSVYPHYYPQGAVSFFLSHHNDDKIKEDIRDGCVYLFEVNDTIIGTCTINENEINRLFVLPIHQGCGYGSRIMGLMEEKIFEHYEEIELSASFPAQSMYRKRGYKETSYHKIPADHGDYLCYYMMKLHKPKGK